jgi:hypothetical protein
MHPSHSLPAPSREFSIPEHRLIASWRARMLTTGAVPAFIDAADYADGAADPVEVIEVDHPPEDRALFAEPALGVLSHFSPEDRCLALVVRKEAPAIFRVDDVRHSGPVEPCFATLEAALDHAAQLMGVELEDAPEGDCPDAWDLPAWLQGTERATPPHSPSTSIRGEKNL